MAVAAPRRNGARFADHQLPYSPVLVMIVDEPYPVKLWVSTQGRARE
jgi:hypothetical protein